LAEIGSVNINGGYADPICEQMQGRLFHAVMHLMNLVAVQRWTCNYATASPEDCDTHTAAAAAEGVSKVMTMKENAA